MAYVVVVVHESAAHGCVECRRTGDLIAADEVLG